MLNNTVIPGKSFFVLILTFLSVMVTHSPARANGASPIDESLITATLHVRPDGDDSSGNGTAAAPFASIAHGLSVAQSQYNQQNIGVRILVHPGTYREGIPGNEWAVIFPSPTTSAPVVLEGAGWDPDAPANTGDVILSGSRVREDWTSNGDGTWSTVWPYAWGASPLNGSNPPAVEAFRRYEMVHVDGETYYHIAGPNDTAALSKLTVSEGAFWVDESAGILTVLPPDSVTDLNSHLVEVTTQRKLLYHFRPLAATSDTNIIIRNIVFQHAAPGLMESAVHIQNARNVLVEDVVVRNNKHTGISMDMRAPYTVRRLLATGNGEAGASGRGRNALWEDSDFSHNARQAHISGYYSWTVCGIKLGDAQNTVIRNSRASHNAGFGFWWDTECFRSALVDSVATHNYASGVFIEFNNNANHATPPLGNDTSVLVQNTVLAHNRRPPVGVYMGRGAVLSENENAVFDHVIFYDNDVQLGILENNRGPQGRTIIRHSIVAATLENQFLYANAYGTIMWRQFFDTLNGGTNDNRYFHPLNNPFPNRNQLVELNLNGWRNAHLNNPDNFSTDRAVDSRSTLATSGYSGQPLVSIRTADTYVAEDSETGVFTVSRASPDLSNPLTVHFSIPSGSGFATPGTDYASVGTSVTIPAGEHHAQIVIDPTGHPLSANEAVVRIELSPNASYLPGNNAAQFTLYDPTVVNIPNIAVIASTPLAFEQDEVPGVFTLSRSGSVTDPLDVFYVLSGTATPGLDFVATSGTATFAAGAATTTVVITPIDDDIPELDETVNLTLQPNEAYRIGEPGFPASATVTIRDNDTIPSGPIAVEVEADGTASYPLTLSNPSDSAMTFTVTLPSFSDYTISTSMESGGPVFDWQDISATGTLVTDLTGTNNTWTTHINGQGGEEGMIPFGFEFPFYAEEGGGRFSGGYLYGNGILSLGATRPTDGQAIFNRPLPSIQSFFNMSLPGNVICLFWSNLIFQDANNQPVGTVHFQSVDNSGEGSYDRFIIQFTDVRHVSARNQSITAQAILHSTGEIVFQYKNITIDQSRWGSTIGIQDVTPGKPNATQIAYNSNFVSNGLAVRITPPARWISASQQSVIVPPGASADFTLNFNAFNLPAGENRTAQFLVTSTHPGQPPVAIQAQMHVIEPTDDLTPPASTVLNLTNGIDGYEHLTAYIRSGQPDANFGTVNQLLLGLVNGNDRMRPVLSFPLSEIPADSEIIEVSLDIVTAPGSSGSGSMGQLEVRQLTGTPTETQVTWNRRDADAPWSTPGGDALPGALSTAPGFVQQDLHVPRNFPSTPDFVEAAQAAYAQGEPLNLLVLSPSSEGQSADQFARIGAGNNHPTARPRLRILYRPLQISPEPHTPSAFQAVTVNHNTLELSWEEVTNATGYRIERSADGETGWTLLADLPTGAIRHTDTGLEPETTWFYRILATNEYGDSPWSPTVQASTLPSAIPVTYTAGVNGYNHLGATIRSGLPNDNFGTNTQIIVGLVNGNDRMRGVLSFPLEDIPQGAVITDVTLELTTATQAGVGTLGDLALRALAATPVENQVTWINRSTATPWATPGGDWLSPVLATLPDIDATQTGTTHTFTASADFLNAVQDALDNEEPLDLIVYSPDAESQTENRFVRFASDDESDTALRPRLKITYSLLPALTAFEQWLIDAGLPLDSDPSTVLHGGGPTLAQAYAFGVPLDGIWADHKPQRDPSEPGVFALTFFRARSELVYEVRASSDLQTWTVVATNPGEAGEQVSVPDPQPMPSQTTRFLGLWVISDP
jgi:hypothetical protein